MNNFKRLLEEKFLKSAFSKSINYSSLEPVDFFTNPSRKEIIDLEVDYAFNEGIRGIIESTGDLIAWRGDLLHTSAYKLLGMKGVNYNDKKFITVIIKNKKTVWLGDDESLDTIKKIDLNDMIKKFKSKNRSFIIAEEIFDLIKRQQKEIK